MKRFALLWLLIFFLFSLYAGEIKQVSTAQGLRIFDKYGKLQSTATDLDISWSALTSDEPAEFVCQFGRMKLYENTAVTVGADISEMYVHLLHGTIELENYSKTEIIIYTPASKAKVSALSSVEFTSTSENENCTLISGSVSIYDSISGKTTELPEPDSKEEYTSANASSEETTVSFSFEETEPETVSVIPVVVFAQSQKESLKEEPENEIIPEINEKREIKTSIFGNGISFGIKAHVSVPELNLDIASPNNAMRVRDSLENTDFAVGITAAYNSLKLGFRADSINTNNDSYDLNNSSDKTLSVIRLLGSYIDEISYGSKGTLLNIKADRKTNLDFCHPMFGDMDRTFEEKNELSLLAEVTKDRIEITCFADNLSFINPDNRENLGFRFAVRPFAESNLMTGASILATNKTDKPFSFVLFPSFDISFKVFESTKAKGELSFNLTASTEDFSKFLAGIGLQVNTSILTATAGIDVSNKAYMSRTVDYGQNTYNVYSQALTSPVVNMYANAQFKYKNYFGAFSANIPFDFKMGEDLNEIIKYGFTLRGGARLNNTTFWTAIKHTNKEKFKKLSLGCDFDMDISILSFELGYDNNMESPFFLTTTLSLAVDKKLLSRQ